MKKKIISALLASVMLSSTVLAEDINLYFDIGANTAQLNGETIEAPSYLSELGNTMVGLRVVAETIGITVEWNEETRTVKLSDEGLDMRVTIDSDIALMNDTQVKMTEPAVIYNDRTMVPIRFISEGFGAAVSYIEETHSVIVQTSSYEGRCSLLSQSAWSLKRQYPDALRAWLAVTDDAVSAADFAAVWDSLVNTEIMALLPGRTVTNEICDRYRTAASVAFNDMFSLTGVRAMDSDITAPITVTVKNDYAGYSEFTYTPSTKKIEEKKVASSGSTSIGTIAGAVGGLWEDSSSGGSSGGGGGGSVSKPTIKPTQAPEVTLSPTTVPTAEPETTPTIVPTAVPTIKPTAEPTIEPEEETPKPTRRPASGGGAGGSWEDDKHKPVTPKPTKAPQPTQIPETPLPTEIPSATLMPDETVAPESTEEPDSAGPPSPGVPPMDTPSATDEPELGVPPESADPTPEPTPQITDGPEGDDNHFDNVINGESKSESTSLQGISQPLYLPWRIGFKPIQGYKNIWFRIPR